MNAPELDADQAAILMFVAKLAKLNSEVGIQDFSFEGSEEYFYTAAYSRMPSGGAPVHMVVGLPKETHHVFVAISDGEPKLLAGMVASFQHYDHMRARLHCGHTVPLIDNEQAPDAGWSAALFCPLDFLIEGFPDEAEIKGKGYCFSLAVLIDARERQFKIDHGFDALMGLFEAEDRDIVSFYQGKAR
ncbi:hypothetical protein ACEN9F_00955 [Duganella sp. CT11-25]|uniref:hypothetical protein n=1 Tax=unclassified Duganella TaxID=2636909 RepID=UPI0039B0FEA5